MLTYWSLEEYSHIKAVKDAKAALAKQMRSLMLSQWHQHRHICENYNPHKNADTSQSDAGNGHQSGKLSVRREEEQRVEQDAGDCTGTTFYHWGALTGLLSLFEAGQF